MSDETLEPTQPTSNQSIFMEHLHFKEDEKIKKNTGNHNESNDGLSLIAYFQAFPDSPFYHQRNIL